MELRCPIHGSIELNAAEVKLIDSVAYQRLRAIKQLGFSEFSFPGATHNRYLHSIGVAHLASQAFESALGGFGFSSSSVRLRLKQSVRLAAFLHDLGHGPLSHTTEQVMPALEQLGIKVYEKSHLHHKANRQANHEDYTIKFITDSSLTSVLKSHFFDIEPIHVACLIDRSLEVPDDFFHDQGFDFRTILSQLVSSEMDADRMDYLERDAYYCGTNYGKVELEWLLANLTYHESEGKLHLALNRRALYTFDDFLLSRHHMHLMVYFHHKSIIYEEFLNRYFRSKDCTFFLPADIEAYIGCTDYALYQHLAHQENEWARRIAERRTYRNLFEVHSDNESDRPELIKRRLFENNIDVIHSNSKVRLSRYHQLEGVERAPAIFVVDQYDRHSVPLPLESCTEIFQKYEQTRSIDRLYVPPEKFEQAESLLVSL